jgi:transposase
MLLVGIDWADDHHDICLVDGSCQNASASLARFRIAQSVDGFATLHERVREYETSPEQVLVAIETPHGLLVHDLVRHGYCVYPINPKSVSRYRDRRSPASPKDDARDAFSLAHILRTDREHYAPLQMRPEQYRLLGELCQDLRQMIDDRTQIINRLTSCLKAYYPQALNLFSRLDSQVSVAFLRAFPEPAKLTTLSQKRFLAFLEKHQYSHPERAEKIHAQATSAAPAADSVITRSSRMRMLALLDQLVTLQAHIRSYEQQIQTIFRELPESDHISNFPGVGERIGPELLATLGPRPDDGEQGRFLSSEGLKRLSGAAPVTKQSGRYREVKFRRACDRRLRRTLYDWAKTATRTSRWAHAYYEHCREHGHRYNTILRNLAQKLIAILYRLWATGEPYDEQRHINNLKMRGVIWAVNL